MGGKLQRHLKIHSEERPNQLTQCDKNFRTAGNLNPRLQVYSGQKSFKGTACTQCDKCFGRSGSLKRRMKMHSGEKAHKCTQCAKALELREI